MKSTTRLKIPLLKVLPYLFGCSVMLKTHPERGVNTKNQNSHHTIISLLPRLLRCFIISNRWIISQVRGKTNCSYNSPRREGPFPVVGAIKLDVNGHGTNSCPKIISCHDSKIRCRTHNIWQQCRPTAAVYTRKRKQEGKYPNHNAPDCWKAGDQDTH